ncbi:hypothetical protein CNO14_07355 (plasmid) [Borrelia miyamotoi]|uniref:Uncharacterized protein n=3 Tax=Borrelia miyamotoi TaxID=47466 RepID=A0AAQ3HFY6_9SPIR|nr:hypothetical protein [Borrelia miyamotoi]ATQ17871.1 hypothetical protein CNO12_06170 [Borrelia miyamotoi]ATQ20345.1 hypothetical protein CNO10_06015 [Borrelia miyamotoi]ATQ21490.1 hypothetical protein CNO09_05355 [Borrelia miyamotoi]ATQ21549.1 hypothetical protein CNO09_05680 [Borrelia miyamotoi]QBK62542.1 hypothetical protein EZU67_05140 [Borrelia miyamotoi]
MKSKYDKKDINVEFSIIDSWRLNVEFFIRNIWLIMFALFLFFFNVLHSHRGIVSYNVGSSSNLYFTLPFTIVIIIVPSSILLYFLSLLRKRVVEGIIKASVFACLERVSIFVLLVIGLVTQSVSSWMSFESFFSLMFEDTIRDTVLSVKKSQSEKEEGIRKLLSDKEQIIKGEIASIELKIKNNNDRIEFAKNKHLNLDYTYRTMKQDYMREIENAKSENKALFHQRDEYLQSLRDLRFKLGNLIETTAVNNNRFKAANVLNGTSVVIARDDYFNIMFVYSLLLLSVCLDIFLAMVFCIIQNAYHKFYEKKLLLLGGVTGVSNSSFKQKIRSRRLISSLGSKKASKSIEESLEFVTSNLEADKRTIKSISKIRKDTNLSHYRIRKYLADLMERGLIIKKKQRLILNVDAPLK